MIDTNELREKITIKGLDVVADTDILELLDRLEAAESDAAHQKALADSALRVAEGWEEKCNSLRAKITEMEKQEPVGTALLCTRCSTPFDGDHYCPACGYHTATEKNVYALPGAKGE